MGERREQLSIDDFGNLLTGRSNYSMGGSVTQTFRHVPTVSTSQIEDEIQDQIQWYRKEVERKEKLITDLKKTDLQAMMTISIFC